MDKKSNVIALPPKDAGSVHDQLHAAQNRLCGARCVVEVLRESLEEVDPGVAISTLDVANSELAAAAEAFDAAIDRLAREGAGARYGKTP